MADARYSVEIDSRRAQAGADQFNRATDGMRTRARNLERSTDALGAGFGRLNTWLVRVAATMGTGLLGREIIQASDAFQRLSAQLTVLVGSSAQADATLKGLSDIAERTRTPVADLATSYLRTARAAEQMGRTQGEVLRFTETLSKAVQISGAAGSEASAGILQLSQALASGRFQGDEFRSVAENLPIVMQILQRETGKTAGELRKLAGEGKLTGELLFNSLVNASKRIDEQFSVLPQTAGSAFNLLRDEISRTTGRIAEQEGVSRNWAEALNGVRSLVGGPDFQDGLRTVSGLVADLGTGIKNLTADLKEGIIQARAWWGAIADTRAAQGLLSTMEQVRKSGFFDLNVRFAPFGRELFSFSTNAATQAQQALQQSALGQDATRRADELRAIREFETTTTRGTPVGSATPSSRLPIAFGAGNNEGELKRLAKLKERAQEILEVQRLQAQLQQAEIEGNTTIQRALEAQLALHSAIPPEIRKKFPDLAAEIQHQVLIREELERQKTLQNELRNVGEEVGRTITDAFRNAAQQGRSFADTLKQIIARLIEVAAQKAIIDPFIKGAGNLFAGQAFGAGQSGIGASIGSVITAGLGFATGGVFDQPVALAGAGFRGVMAEAGPEAIMPLKRGPGGRLGVEASGGATGPGVVNITITGDATERTVETMRQIAEQIVSKRTPGIVQQSTATIRRNHLNDRNFLRR